MQISQVRKVEDKKSSIVAGCMLVGAVPGFILDGWAGALTIVFGIVLVSKFFVKPMTKQVGRIEALAEAKMEPVRAQIERHQAIVDAYDFGSPDAKNS